MNAKNPDGLKPVSTELQLTAPVMVDIPVRLHLLHGDIIQVLPDNQGYRVGEIVWEKVENSQFFRYCQALCEPLEFEKNTEFEGLSGYIFIRMWTRNDIGSDLNEDALVGVIKIVKEAEKGQLKELPVLKYVARYPTELKIPIRIRLFPDDIVRYNSVENRYWLGAISWPEESDLSLDTHYEAIFEKGPIQEDGVEFYSFLRLPGAKP